MFNLEKKSRVLIIVAHTDDETIGMGGTIAKLKDAGHEIFCMAMTDGISARLGSDGDEVKARQRSCNAAADTLGFNWINNQHFPDNALDTIPLIEVVRTIEETKRDIAPDLVFTHFYGDLNIDHSIVARAVLTAFRPHVDSQSKAIMTFEVASSTDYAQGEIAGAFIPNIYVDISATWTRKQQALNCYSDEMKSYPNSRSICGISILGMHRGVEVGIEIAEAFNLVRHVQ